MDTSEQYIKMCEKAERIQIEKFDGEGLVAGDCIWNGTQHLWLANDFFGFSGLWQKKIPYAYITCMEDSSSSVVFSQEDIMGAITMRKEKYVLTKIAGFVIWLPRQDQLQEMVGDFDDQMILMKSCYHFDYMEDELFSEHFGMKSMEQLWLAFVMKEKYNKVWNGEKWNSEKPLD